MNEQQIRSFIAVELPEEVKSGLREIQNELKSAGHQFIKWVAPESVHLTLKFLGNISPQKVAEITAVMEEASRGFSSFHLKIGGLGAFPNLNRPRVLWLGISGDVDKLATLQGHIDAGLVALEFAKETRPFAPHLTLARLRDRTSVHEQKDFGDLITKTKFKAEYEITVDSINLMRSQLLPGGAVYSCLSEVKFENSDDYVV